MYTCYFFNMVLALLRAICYILLIKQILPLPIFVNAHGLCSYLVIVFVVLFDYGDLVCAAVEVVHQF